MMSSPEIVEVFAIAMLQVVVVALVVVSPFLLTRAGLGWLKSILLRRVFALDVLTIERALPWAIIALSLGAGIVYFAVGDVRRGVYWVTAAVLNISVTV